MTARSSLSSESETVTEDGADDALEGLGLANGRL